MVFRANPNAGALVYELPVARIGRVIEAVPKMNFGQRYEFARIAQQSGAAFPDRLLAQLTDVSVESRDIRPGPELVSETGRLYPPDVVESVTSQLSREQLETMTVLVRFPIVELHAADGCLLSVSANIVLCGNERRAKAWGRALLRSVPSGEPAKDLLLENVEDCLGTLHRVAQVASSEAASVYKELVQKMVATEVHDLGAIDIQVVSSPSPELFPLFEALEDEEDVSMRSILLDDRNRPLLEGLLRLSNRPDLLQSDVEKQRWYLHSTSDYSVLYNLRPHGDDVMVCGLGSGEGSNAEPVALASSRAVGDSFVTPF